MKLIECSAQCLIPKVKAREKKSTVLCGECDMEKSRIYDGNNVEVSSFSSKDFSRIFGSMVTGHKRPIRG